MAHPSVYVGQASTFHRPTLYLVGELPRIRTRGITPGTSIQASPTTTREHDRAHGTGSERPDRPGPGARLGSAAALRRPRRAGRAAAWEPATCTRSPRLVAIPLFDPTLYDAGRLTNRDVSSSPTCSASWIEAVEGELTSVGYLALPHRFAHRSRLTEPARRSRAQSFLVR